MIEIIVTFILSFVLGSLYMRKKLEHIKLLNEAEIREIQDNAFYKVFEGIKNKKVHMFQYCGNVHESSYATISLHLTKEGAEKAMKADKEKAAREHKEIMPEDYEFDFDFAKDWIVVEKEILQ